MRLSVEGRIDRAPGVVFGFVARDHWRNHPRWDPNIVEIIPLESGPIRAGSRARVRRRRGSGDELLEVLEFEPESRWVSQSQIGPFFLVMTALIEPAEEAVSRLTLIADTRARGAVRYLLPVLAPLFRRQMRRSLRRIKELVEKEDTKDPLSDDKLADLLKERDGITIARRTITKYRKALNIASSNQRRVF
jgi:hypothetical protein